MRVAHLGIAALTAGLCLAAAPDDTEKAKKDAAALKGKWTLTGIASRGESAPEGALNGIGVTFKETTYSQTKDDEVLEEGEFVLDPGKTPRAVDFKIKKGTDNGKTQLGIYEIDGDTLTLTVAPAGSDERPTSTKTGKDSSATTFTFKRLKD